MKLFALLDGQARQRPQATAFVEIGEDAPPRTLTYAALRDAALRMAATLSSRGVRAGDRVILDSENSLEWVAAWFGINAVSAVAVPLDFNLSRAEVDRIVADCTPAAGLFSARQASVLFPEGVPCWAAVLDPAVAGSDAGSCPSAGEGDGLAALIYTSGTTGVPKAVMLGEENYLANLESIRSLGLVDDRDVFLALLPFYHSFPFMVNLLLCVAAGARCVVTTSLKPPVLMGALKEQGVTILAAVPAFYRNVMAGLLRKLGEGSAAARVVTRLAALCSGIRAATGWNAGRLPFASLRKRIAPDLRYFVAGGARLDEDLFRFYTGLGFDVQEGYGLSETSPVVTLNLPGRAAAGSAGEPVPGVEVRIERRDGFEDGEVMVRGGNVMRGYYRRDDLTAAVLRDGWFATGDLGRLDGEGRLFITGRAKEVIVLPNGKNVYPAEVEERFSTIPGVEECALIPAGAGADLRLALVVRPAAGSDDGPGRERIRRAVATGAAELPDYRRPRDLLFADEPLPRTNLGKLRRFMVERRYGVTAGPELPEAADHATEHAGDACAGAVAAAVRRITGWQGRITSDMRLDVDLKIDSLGRVELAAEIETTMGRTLSEADLPGIATMGDLVEAVRSAPQADGGGAGFDALVTQALSPDESAALDGRGGVAGTIGEAALFFALRLTARLLFRIRLEGTVPLAACILAPNHTSYLDGYVMQAVLDWPAKRRYWFMALTEFFGRFPLNLIRRAAGVTAFDPSVEPARALRVARHLLAAGHPLCIFPEGGRSASGELLPFKRGVAILARLTGVPVHPVRIEGAFEAWPVARKLPRLFSTITVTIGPPRMHDGDDEAFLKGLRDSMACGRS